MPSLLQRLGKGLGEGLVTVGKIGLEEQREARLAKLREGHRAGAAKEEREFRTGEREASEKFKASEAEKDRQARLQAATTKGAKPDKVKKEETDELTGRSVITFESGKQLEYDPETDTYKARGKGMADLSEESKAEDMAWGEKVANRQAGIFSGDEADFPHFKSEERAAEAAAQFRSNARREGKLEEFDTQFAKKGWNYIQELAGVESKEMPDMKAGTNLMKIFKDFERKDYDAIAQQIVSDPNAPAKLKSEAKDYLRNP